MRTTLLLATTAALSLAAPAPAEVAAGPVVTLGSQLGLDYFAREGEPLVTLTTGGPGITALSTPGLRLGLVMPGGRAEVAAGIGADVVGSSYDLYRSIGLVLEGQYYLRGGDAEVSPYVGVHAGVANAGFSEWSESAGRYGLQVGVRRMVAGGNGDVRLELRGGLVQGPYGPVLPHVGLRLGYDLWLR